MRRVEKERSCWLALASVCAICVSCGRTSLTTSFQSETTEAGSNGSGASGRSFGGASSAGSSSGGAFGVSGSPSASGAFGMAGMAVAGTSSGGQPGRVCELSPSDCRTAQQTECELSNFLCEGKLSYRNLISSLQQAHVVDVKTARDGRVAVAGYYEGQLRSDTNQNGSDVLMASSAAVDGFVASFSALGVFEWAYGFGAAGRQALTGVAFAPGGDIVVQGAWGDPPSSQAFVARLDERGALLWQNLFSNEGDLGPGQVAIDNDGVTTLVGAYRDRVQYETHELLHEGYYTYLLRLAADGTVLSLQDYGPAGWLTTGARRLVVDDEDNLIIAGNGMREANIYASFLAKLTPSGDVVFAKEFRASYWVWVGALAVDREMRVTVGGDFTGTLELEDRKIESSPQQGESAWLARYSRIGEPTWSRLYTDDDPTTRLFDASTDPQNNLLVAGATSKQVFVRKLRSDGTDVWLHSFPTTPVDQLAVASDNDSNVWLGGSFQQSIAWGDDETTARGSTDGFLIRLSP